MDETKCLICGHPAQFPWGTEPQRMIEITLKAGPYEPAKRLAVHGCCLDAVKSERRIRTWDGYRAIVEHHLAVAAGLKEEER